MDSISESHPPVQSTEQPKKSPGRRRRRAKDGRRLKGALVVDTITAWGLSISIKKRPRASNLVLEFKHPETGHRSRPSSGTSDPEAAKAVAEALAKRFYDKKVGGALNAARLAAGRVTGITLGELFDAYREAKLPRLKAPRPGSQASARTNMDLTLRVFEACWGRGMPVQLIDQPAVDLFQEWRLSPTAKWAVNAKGVSRRGGKQPAAGAVRESLRRLSAIIRWGANTAADETGRPLVARNPLATLSWGKSRPRHQKMPIASESRFVGCIAVADAVEARVRATNANHGRAGGSFLPLGAYKMYLRFIRWTGRRKGSIVGLIREDVLLTPESIRAVSGIYQLPEGADEIWRYGALRFRKAFDKQEIEAVVPMCRRLRDAVVLYLKGVPADADALLFCSPSDRLQPLSNSGSVDIIRRLEEAAREAGYTVPVVKQGKSHPYRRYFRSERSGLFEKKLIAEVGGWMSSDSRADAMDGDYLQFPAEAWLACVEYDVNKHGQARTHVPGVFIEMDLDADAESAENENSHTDRHTSSSAPPECIF